MTLENPAEAGFLLPNSVAQLNSSNAKLRIVAPIIICALTVAIYWIGLSGSFLLDDAPSFGVVRSWFEGNTPLREAIVGSGSWLDSRSVAMASFVVNVAAFGYDPFFFKLGNLLLHIACGLSAYALFSRLLARDAVLSSQARLVALAVAAAWLFHPLNVSTVLYAVQRMTQIAALLSLLALWLYLSARNRMLQGDRRASLFLLGVPLLTIVGIQGKQNAAVIPALCLVVELAYYQKPRSWPRSLKAFYLCLLALPATAAIALVAFRPEALLRGYWEYHFSPTERLMSQARALCHYIKQILAPHTPKMGVNTDDFAVSTGLLSPPTTLLAIAFLLLASAFAWRLRKAAPTLLAGWGFFLVAHGVESTLLPLELYYEHRNYLPAFGILLAFAAIVALAAKRLRGKNIRVGRIGAVTLCAALALLALQTHGRARVWSDPLLLAESELRNHPHSARAVVNYMGMVTELGRADRAYEVAKQALSRRQTPWFKGQVMLFRTSLDCASKSRAEPSQLQAALDTLPPRIDLPTFLILDYLRASVVLQPCHGLDNLTLAQAFAVLADRAKAQPDDFKLKWALRNQAALLYASEEKWEAALRQARLGWQPSTPGEGARSLIEILLVNGRASEAERIYAQAMERMKSETGRHELSRVYPLILKERESSGYNLRRVRSPPSI